MGENRSINQFLEKKSTLNSDRLDRRKFWCDLTRFCVRFRKYLDYCGEKLDLRIFIRGHSTTTWTKFCDFLTPPPCVDKNRHFLTPSPHLVHIVIEWPLNGRLFALFLSPWLQMRFNGFVFERINKIEI